MNGEIVPQFEDWFLSQPVVDWWSQHDNLVHSHSPEQVARMGWNAAVVRYAAELAKLRTANAELTAENARLREAIKLGIPELYWCDRQARRGGQRHS